jgi:uncharacterized protein YdaU (DUF1376 family)
VKRPAYQWNVNDARGDEVFLLMSYEQRGIYRELLDQQWVEGSIPADLNQLAVLLHLPPSRFAKVWPLVSTKFRSIEGGRLVNNRLEEYRRELDAWCEKQAQNGRKGGRPKTHGLAMGNPRDSQTEPKKSSSTQTSTKTVSKEQKRGGSAENAPSGTREFLIWFQSEYKARRNGAVYFVKWEAHGAIVKRLLTGHPIERLKKHAIILLRSNEQWIESTDRGIEVLSAKINWLEERLCEWEAKQRSRQAV